jgi:hypothetical protein
MCKCGCNTCETKGPLLTEGKVKSLLSEGLQYHINKKIPLFETVYRIGSDKHLALIKEARKMYSRNVIDLCEEDEALIGTHLGEFDLYEGESVPLDLPMVEAEIDYEKEKTWKIQDKFPIEVTARKGWSGNYYTIEPKPMDISYDVFIDLGSGENVDYTSYDYTTGEAQWTSDSLEQIKQWEKDNQDKIKVLYPKSLNEEVNNSDLDNAIYRLENVLKYLDIEYKETRRGEKYVQINYIPVTKPQSQNPEFVNVRYNNDEDLEIIKNRLGLYILNENKAIITFKNDYEVKMPTQDQVDKFFALTQNEMHYLNSKPVAGQEKTFNKMEVEPWDEYDLSNWNALVRKAKSKGKINEARKYNQEELLRLDLIARRKFNCDYEKCTDEQKSEVLKDKIKVGVKEALQEVKKEIGEAEFKGKEVALNKPKRGGSKAYYVYVRDPKTKKIKKVSFGSGGLRAKIKNKEARNAFAARHNCKNKKDRTKAGYWSCNLPRYAKVLGLGANMNTFW